MRFMPVLAAVAVALVPAAAGSAADATITGCWFVESGDAVVALAEEDGRIIGRIVGLQEPYFLAREDRGEAGAPRTDLENPDPALRDRPMAGLAIVRGLERDGDRWTDGRIYDPQSGNSYAARAELDDDGTLRIRGYVGSPLFGRTTRWTPATRRPEEAARMVEKARPVMPGSRPGPSC